MKYFLTITIAVLAVFTNGTVTAQRVDRSSSLDTSTPPCRAGTLDLRAKKGGAKPQSILTLDSCQNALATAYDWEQAQINSGMTYDTMKWYITDCYKNATVGKAWGGLADSQDSISQTAAGRLAFHNFVIYALGLRNDNDWFCQGFPLLGDIYVDSKGNIDYPSQLAILQFLIQNPRCAGNFTNDSAGYYTLRNTEYQTWQDTAHFGEIFDTTIPTLQQLGLDSVLKLASASDVHYDAIGTQIIGNAQLSPNPTTNGATVTLEIEREAYVHIELFDLLGNKIGQTGFEGVFEPGTSATELNLTGLPPGSYFVRITTANNEVQTLKLSKE